MTAPLFFLPRGELAGVGEGAHVLLSGPEGRHAAAVMRLGVGEEISLSDQSGRVAHGVVAGTAKNELDVAVRAVEQVPPPDVTFTLAQALAKGDRDELAVETSTELGVDAVIPWQAPRSVVKWVGERGERSRRKWDTVALAAAKQSRRALVPVVEPACDTKALVSRARAAARVIVLHEEATARLVDVELPSSGEVLLVVGPEGGIGPDELALLRDAGADVVRLGEHVLRASTAGPAALAALSARVRW